MATFAMQSRLVPSARGHPRQSAVIVLALYVAVCALFIAVSVPGAAKLYGADVGTWVNPALGLVKHGAFVDPDNPAVPDGFRTPGYPAFLALAILIGGERYDIVAVIIQLVLLFGVGLVAFRITEEWLPGYGVAALALTVFNPNSLSTALLLKSETVYSLGVALLAWAVLAYCRRPSVRAGALSGIALGASCLIRPDVQFLIPLLPLVLVVLVWLPGARPGWSIRLGAAGACLLAALLVVSPWLARNVNAGFGPRLTTAGAASYYIWDSAGQIEMTGRGVSEKEASARMKALRDAFIAAQGPAWHSLSRREQDERLALEGVRTILRADPGATARTVVLATLQFMVAGGAGNFLNMLGYADVNPYEVAVKQGHSSYWNAWRAAIRAAPMGALAITVISVGFVIVMRILGLAGMVTMARRGEWRLLFVTAAAIAYFALVIPFYGNSRFRVPAELFFMLLALFGVAGLRALPRKLSSGSSGVRGQASPSV